MISLAASYPPDPLSLEASTAASLLTADASSPADPLSLEASNDGA